MSKILVDANEGRGFQLSRHAGPKRGISNMRLYQLTNSTGFIVLDVVELLNLREVLKVLDFDNPAANETELTREPLKYEF